MAYFNEFPYTRTYDSDLGWLIRRIQEVAQIVDNYVSLNSIQFADPINWDITEQYPRLTIVLDKNGNAFISRVPVPAGVALSNEDYWTEIYSTQRVIDSIRDNIAYNNGDLDTASQTIPDGDLFWYADDLYWAITEITAGTRFVVGTNCRNMTVDEKINLINNILINQINNEIEAREQAIAAETQAREQAIAAETQAREQAIAAETQAREQADAAETQAREQADAEMDMRIKANTIHWVTPQMFGALADGVNDDTQAIQNAIDAGKTVYFPKGIYRITDTLNITAVGNRLLGINLSMGDTDGGSAITMDSDGDAIVVNPFCSCIIENLTITRKSGFGNGLTISRCDGFLIKNCRFSRHNNGFQILGTSFSRIEDCISERNTNDGFYFSNLPEIDVCQIQVKGCLSELNTGVGFHFVTRTPSMAVGIFESNMTFANSRGGIVYEKIDPAYQINGVHIINCFIGSDDNLGGIFDSAIGMPFVIENCFFELMGEDKTGPEYNTPPSKNANCINIVNAESVSIIGCIFANNSAISIRSAIPCTITGCQFRYGHLDQNVADILAAGSSAIISNNLFNTDGLALSDYTTNCRLLGNSFTSDVTIATGAGFVARNNINYSDTP